MLVIIGFCLILGKAFYLQVLEQSTWLERSRIQTETVLQVPSYRGSIVDRRGRLMAYSVPQPSLSADPARVANRERTAAQLAPILGEPGALLHKKMTSGRRFVWVKRHLSDQQAIAVENLKAEGLHLVNEYKRFYPFRQVGGQVLGFVGLDGKGLEGIEKSCDRILLENVYSAAQVRDGLRKSIWLRSSLPPEPGEGFSVRLSLDAYLQYLCETELEQGIRKYKARAGEVVLLDPRTFEVLAMANWPFFDPNLCDKNNAEAWRNRAITDSFEPGSTFKVFVVAAALEERTINTRDRIFCENGKCRLAGHTINDVHPYGWLTIPEVVKYSSNIAASKLALQLGSEKYYKYIQGFGFGSLTGIGLPGEARGLLRPWKKWRPIDLATTGFGQSIGVTALQLSLAVASIANGGEYAQPLILQEVLDSRGQPVTRLEAQVLRRVSQEKTARQISEMMRSVTEEGGTGVNAAPDGYTVAGKTGTAQVVDPETGRYAPQKYTALFTGFTPAEEPRLVMTVVIHEPQGAIYGGVVAAPVFRNIAAKALPYLGVSPQYGPGKTPLPFDLRLANSSGGDLRKSAPLNQDQADPTLMPNVIGLSLKAALQRLAHLGVQTKLQGSGKVVGQDPPEGTALVPGTEVELALNEVHQ